MYKRFIKRLMDIVLSILALLVLTLPLLLCMVAIYIEDPGPVVFKQLRYGKNRVPFTLYKLRSMRMDTPHDVPTCELHNAEDYILTVGNFIRKTSLDEFPQLINIIMGNMSVIGPRPVVLAESDLIEAREHYGANGVLPGLSGLAQISGRDTVSIERKAQLDGVYVRKMSFTYDVKLIFKTFLAVITSDGIVEGDNVSFERE